MELVVRLIRRHNTWKQIATENNHAQIYSIEQKTEK